MSRRKRQVLQEAGGQRQLIASLVDSANLGVNSEIRPRDRLKTNIYGEAFEIMVFR